MTQEIEATTNTARWPTWTETRATLNLDEAAVARARAELEAEEAAYRLAEIRREQHRTQTDVARDMGVSQKRVSEIERGDLTRTEVDTISRYVAALGGRIRIVADFPGHSITVR
ncbi:helix-turn-helix domain-containing protein [Jiangella endophytica]|uniref:helix-turn-helix domain-containing protein n=1 Tax=Jiangella endophytica TaxID=1623398 RepID=UPI000E34A809|nr:XRE family transcriptional regulator [Jiangella endophytica]